MGDPKMRKGLLFAKRSSIFAKKDFYYGSNYLKGLCLILNIIKLKLNDINLSIYAVEIVLKRYFTEMAEI